MKRHRVAKSVERRRRRRRLRKLKAACLSLGLATAWGGAASADTVLRVEVTPAVTLTNAVVVYGNNVSTEIYIPIGTAPAGQTTAWIHTLTDEFANEPEKLVATASSPYTGVLPNRGVPERRRPRRRARDA